jgi:general stress protein 26
MAEAINDDQKRETVRGIVRDVRTCMFATLDAEGAMHARPMAPMTAPDATDTIWFFTSAQSPKAQELGADGHVLLTFTGHGNTYLSLRGTAEVKQDAAQQKALWSEAARPWFPKGPDSPDLALIAFHPEHAEYWDSPAGAVVFAIGYVKAMLTGRPTIAGENAKVAFTG